MKDFDPTTTLPTSKDWYEEGFVTTVSDEGACGSGYAFASAGALESMAAISGKSLLKYSK